MKRHAEYPLLLALAVGLACGLTAAVVARCEAPQALLRALLGAAAAWLLTALVRTLLAQTRRLAPPAAVVDLAEQPLTMAMADEAKQEAQEPELSAQEAARAVSRMLKT